VRRVRSQNDAASSCEDASSSCGCANERADAGKTIANAIMVRRCPEKSDPPGWGNPGGSDRRRGIGGRVAPIGGSFRPVRPVPSLVGRSDGKVHSRDCFLEGVSLLKIDPPGRGNPGGSQIGAGDRGGVSADRGFIRPIVAGSDIGRGQSRKGSCRSKKIPQVHSKNNSNDW